MISQLRARAEEASGEEAIACGAVYNEAENMPLRIGAIFIVLVTSVTGTLLPIVLRRTRVPVAVFDFAKYFGSGVIIATAFMHLLTPAFEALGSECLSGAWKDYDWAPALAMASVFAMFIVELSAFRAGEQWLARRGIVADHAHAHHPAEADEATLARNAKLPADQASLSTEETGSPATATVLGVAILELGVLFHSAVIGIALAVTASDEFATLLVVIIFHQTFEGIGLGARLSELPLAQSLNWVPYACGLLYSAVTPVFMAIGLGVRSTYNAESTAASIVAGVLDALSAGILLYTGFVELLAREFLFSQKMRRASNGHVAYACCCILLGAGLMALLARWA